MSSGREVGRALDAEVAEKVMGLGPILGYAGAWGECGHDSVSPEPGEFPVYLESCVCDLCRKQNRESLASCISEYGWGETEIAEVKANHESDWIFGHSWQCLAVVRPYSTDIAAAWEVVEKMREDGDLRIEEYAEGWLVVSRLSDGREVDGQATTAPLAICLAALSAATAEGERR